MKDAIPSAHQVMAALRPLSLAQVRDLSDRSGVPFRTLLNIRFSKTRNPGIETVRKFFPLLPVSEQKQAIPSVERSCVATDVVSQQAGA